VTAVKVGFITLTEVTSDGDHADYNAWHQLDHMPEQFAIPGVVCGQRWVLAPDCAAAAVAVDDPLGAFHYLTLYLMTEPVDETLAEFAEVRERLARLGRFYEHRRARLSGAWVFLEALAAARTLVAPDVIPYRSNLGAYVVIDEPDPDAPSSSLDAYLRERHTAHFPRLLDVPGVAGLWSFATRRWAFAKSDDPPLSVVAQDATRITVAFLDADPLRVAADVGPLVEAHWAGAPVRPRFAGPLRTITPWQWDWFDPPAS
jgi:hypothetical protein